MLRSLRLTALNLLANRVQANAWRGESVNAFDIRNDDAVVTQARVIGMRRPRRGGAVNPTDGYAQMMAVEYLEPR